MINCTNRKDVNFVNNGGVSNFASCVVHDIVLQWVHI